jgi:hypothetical protein
MLMIVADNYLPECELKLAMIEDLQLLVEEHMYKKRQMSCKNIYRSISNSVIRTRIYNLFGYNYDKLGWDENYGIVTIDNGINSNCSNFYPLLKSNDSDSDSDSD